MSRIWAASRDNEINELPLETRIDAKLPFWTQ